MYKPAKHPNDLEKYFIERANRGDLEGLVALYETEATIADGNNVVASGRKQIREFFKKRMASRPQFGPSDQADAIYSGDLALTSSYASSGDITVEIARRQSDGNWLWVVDQFTLGKIE